MAEPIDCFGVHWESALFDSGFVHVKRRRSKVDNPTGFLNALFQWADGRNDLTGARFRELYEADLEIGDWTFERPLGKGSFGAVALYRKYVFDQIFDEVVVKDSNKRDGDEVNQGRPLLSKEAAVMAQTNDLDADSLLRLRNYKYFQQEKQYRYFFESCGEGNLELLRLKYKAWQIHAPELFLWHLLKWLTEAHTTMTEGPFRSLHSRGFGQETKDTYLIHSDIKTDNVLLKAPNEQRGSTEDYPIVKIGDFGSSRITSPRDRGTNNASQMQRGTEVWFPPEIRIEQNKCNWLFADRSDPKADPTAHTITTQTNLWAMAAILWTFVTGREIEDMDSILRLMLKNRHPPGSDIVDTLESLEHEYSIELRHVVRDCLSLIPKNRPSLSELRKRVDKGLQKCEAREFAGYVRQPDRVSPRPKVYYHANEINEVTHGAANFNLDAFFWRRFVAATLFVPEEWGSLLPPTAPENLKPNNKWSSELQKRWLENMKKAREGKRRREGHEESSEPARKKSKRTKIRGALKDTANAAPFKRRPSQPPKPQWAAQRADSPNELTSTPHSSSSHENGSYRPVLGGFVDPRKAPSYDLKSSPHGKDDKAQVNALFKFGKQEQSRPDVKKTFNIGIQQQDRAAPTTKVPPPGRDEPMVEPMISPKPSQRTKVPQMSQRPTVSYQASPVQPILRSPTVPSAARPQLHRRPRATTARAPPRRLTRSNADGWVTAGEHAAARTWEDRDAAMAALEGKEWPDDSLI